MMKAREWLSGLKVTQPKQKASCGKSPQLMSKSETLKEEIKMIYITNTIIDEKEYRVYQGATGTMYFEENKIM